MIRLILEFDSPETALDLAKLVGGKKEAKKAETAAVQAVRKPKPAAGKKAAAEKKAAPANGRNHKPWTAQEERFLTDNWARVGVTCTAADLANTLGRTVNGLKWRVTKLRKEGTDVPAAANDHHTRPDAPAAQA